jgi:ATP-dependent DNA helicase RecG
LLGAFGAISLSVVQLIKNRERPGMSKTSYRPDRPLIYPERESKTLELKLRLPDFRTLAKTCVAFANGAGGEIVIGVKDGSREINGISESERDRLYDAFPSGLHDLVSPSIIPHLYEKNIDGRRVMMVRIWPGDCVPYFMKALGIPAGVFIRIGSVSRPANEQTIEDLSRENRRISFDEESSGQTISVLSHDRLQEFYRKDTSQRRLLADRVILATSRLKSGLSVTHGGILMFCDDPDRFIPEALVMVSRFAGISGRNIVQTIELKGPISLLAESAFALLEQWLDRDLRLNKMHLTGTSLIPHQALREAIINALVHRKYSIPGPIKIALYDDRLEIFSPGAFPGLISITNLGDGTTFLRNIVVARIARKMHLMEKLGTGIRLIFDSCRQAGLRKPEYNESGDFVKLTFFFEHVPRTAEITEEAIIEMAQRVDVLRPSDLSREYNVSRNTISRRLDALVRKRLLQRHGKGAGVFYKHLLSGN